MMVQYITKLIQLNFPSVQHMFQQLHSPQAGKLSIWMIAKLLCRPVTTDKHWWRLLSGREVQPWQGVHQHSALRSATPAQATGKGYWLAVAVVGH